MRILKILEDLWIYDIEMLSTPWMIYTVAPAAFYVMFMFIKWVIITCPIWILISIVAEIFKTPAIRDDRRNIR